MQMVNIDASLSHGNFLDKKQLTVLYIGLFVSLLLPLLAIILLITQIEWDGKMIFAMVVGNIMFISFFSVLVFIKIKNNKLKRKIMIWIKDAIEVKAYSKNIGENRLGIQPKAVKIQVRFKINDMAFTRESTAKAFGGQKGYLGTYKKYADREIDILYSPKYDEVLILKQQQ